MISPLLLVPVGDVGAVETNGKEESLEEVAAGEEGAVLGQTFVDERCNTGGTNDNRSKLSGGSSREAVVVRDIVAIFRLWNRKIRKTLVLAIDLGWRFEVGGCVQSWFCSLSLIIVHKR